MSNIPLTKYFTDWRKDFEIKDETAKNLSNFEILDTDKALEEAINNIDKYYSVVGVLEELEKSLIVMEKKLPLFFTGALAEYRNLRAHGKGTLRKVCRNVSGRIVLVIQYLVRRITLDLNLEALAFSERIKKLKWSFGTDYIFTSSECPQFL